MNSKNLFSEHPFSIIFYLIYILLIGRISWIEWYLDSSITLPHPEKVMKGEGLMFGYFFLLIIAFTFILTTISNMLGDKTQRLFYEWLLAFIVFPLILFWIV
jgi:hypothetical protein